MLPRTLSRTIKNASENFPVLLLTGPRQVGKTTLLEAMSGKNRRYVSLDDLEQRNLALNDPALFLQTHTPPVIIDEVQYAPGLFPYIKMYVDRHKKPGDFWLTGSQKFHLMKGIRETMAGRVAIIDLLGLSYAEMTGMAGKSVPFLPSPERTRSSRNNPRDPLVAADVYKIIFNGSFPGQFMNNNKNRELFYSSYIKTYIERDVKDSYLISNDIAFYNFIRAAAARTGQLLNYADMARDVNIDAKTAKSWLSILERSGLVKLLEPYYNNITKRIIKTSKLYFLDTGLCAYLTGWDSPKTLESGALSGAILETFVFAEILKSYWHNGREVNIYFYRDNDQKEIDFVIEANGRLYPMEVKKTATPGMTDIKNFDVLRLLKKDIGEGAVLCLRQDIVPLSRGVTALPVWEI
ncbi:MAG TPA: ATP-binding protein [Spirochaetota bacterium]|nr:ATP-binding protein [Spirochaetota bacterium]